MDDLLSEFLTEANESISVLDVELVKLEQNPNDPALLGNIFRLVHTIKGTCGFLGLPRLEALAHPAATLMGKVRDGKPVTRKAVTLNPSTIDRIKQILDELEKQQHEPAGVDSDLIGELERLVVEAPGTAAAPAPGAAAAAAAAPAPPAAAGSMPFQQLERPLRVGEVGLDELERAFRETAGPDAEGATAGLEAKFG